MALTVKCECGADAIPEQIDVWARFGTVPAICSSCGSVLWFPVVCEQHTIDTAQTPNLVSAELPDLPLGAAVQIIYKEHQLYGKVGKIVGKTFGHYKVAVEGRIITLPENLVTPWQTN